MQDSIRPGREGATPHGPIDGATGEDDEEDRAATRLGTGLTDASPRTPDLPLYTLRNKVTGQTVQTTDPGRALVTGKWKHIGRFKGPILRAPAARAPYFHNGSAATLTDVVRFYDERFGIGFTAREISDLVPFLRAQ